MSLGFMLSNGLPFEKPPLLLVPSVCIGKPSITYKGSLPAEIEPVPRMLILNGCPGSPDVCLTLTPAI